jgi:hypothetical protein
MTVFGFDDGERRTPLRPDSREPDPAQPVEARQPKPTPLGSFKDVELMPECEKLKLQDRARTTAISNGHQERAEDGHGSEAYGMVALQEQ